MKLPTTLILSRDLRVPVDALTVPHGLQLVSVKAQGDAGLAEVDRLCNAHGFPAAWAGDMLRHGRRAIVALRQGGAVACAWISPNELFIDEIAAVFSPPAMGDYFCGDFVAPDARGQGLQRLLIRARLLESIANGRKWATALMFADNMPSTRSYAAEAFTTAAQWSGHRWGRWRLERLSRTVDGLPCGLVRANGLPLPGRWRLRRV